MSPELGSYGDSNLKEKFLFIRTPYNNDVFSNTFVESKRVLQVQASFDKH